MSWYQIPNIAIVSDASNMDVHMCICIGPTGIDIKLHMCIAYVYIYTYVYQVFGFLGLKPQKGTYVGLGHVGYIGSVFASGGFCSDLLGPGELDLSHGQDSLRKP